MKNEKTNVIIKKLKQERINKQLSYQDLSNITGISKSTLQRYENGIIKNIPFNKLQIIIKALNINYSDIINKNLSNEFIFEENESLEIEKDKVEVIIKDKKVFLINSSEQDFLVKYRKLSKNTQDIINYIIEKENNKNNT